MATIRNSNKLIDQLIEETKASIDTVENTFLKLSEAELNYKISPEKWSIAECFEHINISNEHYHRLFEKKIGKYPKNTQKETFKSGRMGLYFTKMLKPINGDLGKPTKTVKKFKPSTETGSLSTINGHKAINYFLKEQKKLLVLLEESRLVNLEKIRIKSALGSWLLFKLGDAFTFMVGHTQRHIIQAQNVLKEMTK